MRLVCRTAAVLAATKVPNLRPHRRDARARREGRAVDALRITARCCAGQDQAFRTSAPGATEIVAAVTLDDSAPFIPLVPAVAADHVEKNPFAVVED